ncbi:signal peptidase complex subunit SPC2, putative [Plasmodium malariae]|nr:signal peptidase complex subunit SPC2, putative [Plasmodium malariae]
MIELLVSFFVISIMLFILEYLFFEDIFMIINTNNGEVLKLFFELDVQKSSLRLAYKLNKQIYCTFFELSRLFNENGYLIENYADKILKQFIEEHGKNFKLKNKKKE